MAAEHLATQPIKYLLTDPNPYITDFIRFAEFRNSTPQLEQKPIV